MRIDLYAKTILTVIAVLLGVIAAYRLLQPAQSVRAQGSFDNVQLTAFSGGFVAFDKGTGDVWEYIYPAPLSKHSRVFHYKITQLGQPLQR